MFNLSQNPRVIISMESLSEAFYRFLQTRSYEDISIQEICDVAGVTRKTFYRNFETKDDVFDYYIYQTFLIDFPQVNLDSWTGTLKNFFSYFETQKPLLLICKRNALFNLLLERLTKYIELDSNYSKVVGDVKDILTFGEYYWQSLAALQVKVLEIWTQRDFKESVNQLVDLFKDITKKLGQIGTYNN